MEPKPLETLPAHSQAAPVDGLPLPATSGPRWERIAVVGAGGMGRVVMVRDRWLGREVAFKEPTGDAFGRRLWREAFVTAHLEHPGIVPIHDLGTGLDGTPYFVMRMVQGRSLAEALAQEEREAHGSAEASMAGRLRLLRNVLAACEAMAYAHSRGVVHRDLKPANIMIGPFGETLVIDWGLALMPGGSEVAVPPDGSGTPRAMSPEQARGEALDRRTDVWSLGLVLFELLTGRPAFLGDDPEAVRREVASGRVPEIAQLAPRAAPELAAIVRRALCADRARRYPDAKALADDLLRYLDGRRVHAHAYTTRELFGRLVRAWRVPLMVTAVAAVVLTVVIVGAFVRVAAGREEASASLGRALMSEAATALRENAEPQAEVLAAHALVHVMDSDGDPLAAARARGVMGVVGGTRPTRQDLGALPCRASAVAGTRALCTTPHQVTLVERGEVRWTIAREGVEGELSADGERVVLATKRQFERLSAATGAPLHSPVESRCGQRLTRAPDGASVLRSSTQCVELIGPEDHQVLVRDVDTCGRDQIFVAALPPAGATKRRWAIACEDDTVVVSSHEGHLRVPLVADAPSPHWAATALAFASEDALLVADAKGGLHEVYLDGRAARRLELGTGLAREVVLSADARHVLLVGDRGGARAVDRLAWAALPRLPRGATAASFDSEGRLVTAGERLERWDLRAVRPRALGFAGGITHVAFSPDGRHLAVAHGPELTVVASDSFVTLARHRWQDNVLKALVFAPDGTLIAHALDVPDVLRFDPLAPLAPLPNPAGVQWRRIVALADGSVLAARYVPGLHHFGAARDPTLILPTRVRDLAASPDGRTVVMLTEERELWSGRDLHAGGTLSRIGEAIDAREIAVLDDGRFVVARPGGVDLYAEGRPSRRFEAPDAELGAVTVSRGLVAAGAVDGTSWLWRMEHTSPWMIARDHAERVSALAIAPDESWVAIGGWDGRLVFMVVAIEPLPAPAAIEETWALDLERALGESLRR